MASLTFAARVANQTGRGIRQIRAGLGRVEAAQERVNRSVGRMSARTRAATAAVGRFSRTAGRQLRTVSQAAARVSAAVGGIAAGGLFAGVQFGAQARDLQRWAGILGITVREVDALNRAARRFGADGDVLFEAVIATVDRANAAVLAGAESQQDFFREFGINARSFLRLDTEGQFNAIANALNRIDKPSQRAAVASALFGDEAVKLLPVIDQIANVGLKGLTEEASRNANLLDGPAARALIQINEKWQLFRDRVESAARGILARFAPAMSNIIDWLTNNAVPRLEALGARAADAFEEFTAPQVALGPDFRPIVGPSRLEVGLAEAFDTARETAKLAREIQMAITDAWTSVRDWWGESVLTGIIRDATEWLFSPLLNFIRTDIELTSGELEGTVRDWISQGVNAGVVAASVIITRRHGFAWGLIGASIIGRIKQALDEADVSPIVSGLVTAVTAAALAFPRDAIGGVFQIAELIVLGIAAAFRRVPVIGLTVAIVGFVGRAMTAAVIGGAVLAGKIAAAVSAAVGALAGGAAGLAGAIARFVGRAMAAAVIGGTVLAGKISAAVSAAVGALVSGAAGLGGAIARWVGRAAAFAASPAGLAIAGAALALLAAEIVTRLTYALGLQPFGNFWDVLEGGILDPYRRSNFLRKVKNLGIDLANNIISGVNSGIGALEELFNGIITGINAVINGLNAVNPVSNIPNINPVSIGRVARLQRDERFPSDAANYLGGNRRIGGADQQALISGLDISTNTLLQPPPVIVNVNVPAGTVITAEALENLAPFVRELFAGGYITAEQAGLR